MLDRLERLARLYLDLAASWLKVPRISSAVTYAGFEMMTDFDVDITLTDDQTPLSEDAKAINPGGGDVVQLPARKLPLIAPLVLVRLSPQPMGLERPPSRWRLRQPPQGSRW